MSIFKRNKKTEEQLRREIHTQYRDRLIEYGICVLAHHVSRVCEFGNPGCNVHHRTAADAVVYLKTELETCNQQWEQVQSHLVDTLKIIDDCHNILDLHKVSRTNEMGAEVSLWRRLELLVTENQSKLATEVEAVIATIPDAVHVREGNGPENLAASLAVSVAKLVAQLTYLTSKPPNPDPKL